MSTRSPVKINGPKPHDGQVWRDVSDGDLLLVVSSEDGLGSRVILLGEGSNLGFCLNESNEQDTPEGMFSGPTEVEYVGMFHEVFARRENNA